MKNAIPTLTLLVLTAGAAAGAAQFAKGVRPNYGIHKVRWSAVPNLK